MRFMNYKPENRILWLFTDFDNIKDFPWLFPDLEKFSFFPDFSVTVATLYFLGEEYCLSYGRLSYIIEVYYIEVPLSVIIGTLLSDNTNAGEAEDELTLFQLSRYKRGTLYAIWYNRFTKIKIYFFNHRSQIWRCYITFDANNNPGILSSFINHKF